MNNFLFQNNVPLSVSKDAVHAIIINEKNEYLFQLRDDKKNIFYPLHWGVFGGGIENEETEISALVREINEELTIDINKNELKYFTSFTFDLSFKNLNQVKVSYYLLYLDKKNIDNIVLAEGIDCKFISSNDFLSKKFIVPLDAFAIWLHHSKKRKFY